MAIGTVTYGVRKVNSVTSADCFIGFFVVKEYNQDLAEWEQAVKNGQKPAEKQHRPPERQSVRNRLSQLQEDGKQNSQPKQRKKSQDRER